jgi:hypothetical protein
MGALTDPASVFLRAELPRNRWPGHSERRWFQRLAGVCPLLGQVGGIGLTFFRSAHDPSLFTQVQSRPSRSSFHHAALPGLGKTARLL